MTHLVVIIFEKADEAEQARQALKDVAKHGKLNIEDSAVVVKGEDGKVHVQNQVAESTLEFAAGGGLIGLLLAFMFPLAGLAIGAAGGALLAHYLDQGVDKKFVQDVTATLKPGNSALLLAVRSADPAPALAALEPFKGTLYHTSFDSEIEQQIRKALE